MKTAKHIFALVFGLLGLIYTLLGAGMTYFGQLSSADPDLPIVGNAFLLLGIAFLIATACIWYFIGRKERQRRAVLAYGIRVTATVTDVRPNYAIKVNRRCPWVAYAECTHPVTGEHLQLHSHNLWNCTIVTGQSVEIAFDQMNEKRFAFDIPEAEGSA